MELQLWRKENRLVVRTAIDNEVIMAYYPWTYTEACKSMINKLDSYQHETFIKTGYVDTTETI